MDDLINEFLVESNENLDRLDQELVKLESDPKSRELLSSIFRTIHTIKGSCGFLGFANLERVTHAGENLLSRLRDGKLSLNAEFTTALLAMVDAVRRMLVEIQASGSDGNEKYPELIENLKRLQEPPASASDKPKESDVKPRAQTPSHPEAERQGPTARRPEESASLRSSEKSGSQAPPDFAAEDPRYRPAPGKLGGILMERGFAAAEDIALALREQERGDRRRLGEILVALGVAKQEDVLAAAQILEDARSHAGVHETIRVDVNLLDKLMNLVGELVLTRNQISQYSARQTDPAFLSTTQQLNLLTTELQGEVTKTRMQPISNVFDKFPRVIRDLAMACGKQVHVEMEGKDTELDKSLLEAIKDPLTHLVRNSVDHGIELPEQRLAKGKRSEGCLFLRACHEGGHVLIEISDDGAGIDVARVKKKALERGVITSPQARGMTDREILNLVFLPGFSTAEKVTNLSGRGVGLDVVKTNIERVNGSVDFQSQPGSGTNVKIKIPLTLAIVPALIVQCGGKRFAIPQVSLIELVRLEAEQARTGIELVHGVPVYRLRGRLLPLVYLARELKLPGLVASEAGNSKLDDAVNIVVLQADDRQFGLLVDEIRDTEEIVVKPLGKQLKGLKDFAGATIMGDGRVALILDVLGLAQSANIISEARDRALAEAAAAQASEQRGELQSFLLFAGPDSAPMALPLSESARLEEFPPAQIEKSGDQWVVQYRGQILPLIRLSIALEERRRTPRHADPLPASGSNPVPVLVLNHRGQTFGIVVEKILDVTEASVAAKAPATRAGILYSAVIADRVTELLDIPAILDTAELTGAHSPEHVETTP